MANGPDTMFLIDTKGNPVGTLTNPLFVSNTGVLPLSPGSGNQFSPDRVFLVDASGNPINNSNPLQFTALN